MDTARQFETVCQLLNRVLERQGDPPVELRLRAEETEQLIAALEYYRQAVDPSSGDVLVGSEYRCPECGSSEVFRAQDEHVSIAEERPDIGVTMFQIDAIAQCSQCTRQVALTQFRPAEEEGSAEGAGVDLYEKEYRPREVVEKL
jgi:DNA-directed RNA polymerase subunit RPC12/RpoP